MQEVEKVREGREKSHWRVHYMMQVISVGNGVRSGWGCSQELIVTP